MSLSLVACTGANESSSSSGEGEGSPAHVEISELLGSDKNLIMSCGNQEITATISLRKQINCDGNVTISFDTTQIHVFDKETEFAIR